MGCSAKTVKVGAPQPKEVGGSKKEILVGRKERTDHMKGLQIKSECNPVSGEAQEINNAQLSKPRDPGGEGRGIGEEVGARLEGSNFTLETSLSQTLSFSPPYNLTCKWNDLHSTEKGTEVQRGS